MSFFLSILNYVNPFQSNTSPTVGTVSNTIEKRSIEDEYEFTNPPDAQEIHIVSKPLGTENSKKISGFSKEKLLEMCDLCDIAYGSNDEKLAEKGCITRNELRAKGYTFTSFRNSFEEAGFIITKGNEVTIAYKGTKCFNNVLTDLNFLFATSEFLQDGGRMHCGFYRSFQDSWKNVSDIIKIHAEEQGIPARDLKFNVTGHSMGGAVAKIAGLCLSKVLKAKDVNVATFADPRVFDLRASHKYNQLLGEKTIRITQHRADPVPALCPGSFGYSHVGAQLRVSTINNIGVHKLSGYKEALINISPEIYASNEDVSLFYYPSKALQYVNDYTIGNVQHYAGQLRRGFFGIKGLSKTILDNDLQNNDILGCK